MDIKILLVDDHKIMCDGLKSLLSQVKNLEVIGIATSGKEAVSKALELNPDIIIMDILMPDIDGIEASRQILEKKPKMKIIALSMYAHKHYLTEMLDTGVAGYLVKGCSFEELTNAIKTVYRGGIYLSDEIAKKVIRGYVGRTLKKQNSFSAILTNKECNVIKMIASGKKTKDIANLLGVSVKTIETYRRQIMNKLDIDNIADLVKYAIKEGLTSINK